MEQASNLLLFANRNRATHVATQVRVAGTSLQRRRGLLDFEEFKEGSGIWILPCEAIHTFGMKFPIDSIFLDKRLRVRSVRKSLKPCRIAFCLTAHSVLELPAGAIERSGTLLGDQLDCRS